MIKNLKYVPILRSRQQENVVLKQFNFGTKICPMIEIVKAKDRINNKQNSKAIYSDIIKDVQAKAVFIDLPVYLREGSSTQVEVLEFNRTVILNLDKRIEFYSMLDHKRKIIPVVASLNEKYRHSITKQCEELRKVFDVLCFRTFINTFDTDYDEIKKCITKKDFLMYDLGIIGTTSPIFRKHRTKIPKLKHAKRILVRSAINTEIYNVNLIHDDVVAEADNSLYDLYYEQYDFDAFGDYVGIKKDDLTSGGSISPGFIIYNPLDNLYYGFKGDKKSLSEFEDTIVPALLKSDVVNDMINDSPEFISNNEGFEIIQNIYNQQESGKNQAKFKKISLLHYLHCMKILLGS